MTHPTAAIKGRCPGAVRPMMSGDGLLVRIRPRHAALTLAVTKALADLAARFGNGQIDLTRRANLQIRGVKPTTLQPLQQALRELDLLDVAPEAEAVRNIIVSPLAGRDPSAPADGRSQTDRLARGLGRDARLWSLPPKFGFLIDDGSAVPVRGTRMDLAIHARISHHGATEWHVLADAPEGPRLLGSAASADVMPILLDLALAFIELSRTHPVRRIRDLPAAARAALDRAATGRLKPATATEDGSAHRTAAATGIIMPAHSGSPLAVGMAAPFGRLEAGTLRRLSDSLSSIDISELRLSPWRAVYLPTNGDMAQANEVLRLAESLGFITDPSDPRLRIDACPGAPACASANGETRGLALRLADLLPRHGHQQIHVSGCSKGCARSAPAEVVVVCGKSGYRLIPNGRADAELAAIHGPDAIEAAVAGSIASIRRLNSTEAPNDATA